MFTRDNTKQIKGIAIILMLLHHLLAISSRIPYGFEVATSISISEMELTTMIGRFGGICVPIFMFLGGYGLYSSCCVMENDIVKMKCNLSEKIVNLFKQYWKVFLIIIPIGCLFFRNQIIYCENTSICSRFSMFSMKEILSDFIGWSSKFIPEWWFFKTYIFTLFLGYVFIGIFKNIKHIYLEIGCAVIWHILISQIFPHVISIQGWENIVEDTWCSNIFLYKDDVITVFLIGIIIAKYNVFDYWIARIKQLNKSEKIAMAVIFIGIFMYSYVFIVPISFNMVSVPLFVFACWIAIEETKIFKPILKLLGKHSMNMWLIHPCLCYYFYPFVKMVYVSRNAIIAFITLLVLSFCGSIVIEWLWKMISRIYQMVMRKTMENLS